MTYTKSNGILKRLGALVMALGLTCALAVSANALEPYTEYSPNLSGLPASHQGLILDFAETSEQDGTLYVYFQDPITIGNATGNISNVELGEGAAEGYDVVSYEDSVLTISYPAGTEADEFSVPLVLTIGLPDHEGGMEMNSTLTISPVVEDN